MDRIGPSADPPQPGFPLTASHVRTYSSVKDCGPVNDGVFQSLVPALLDHDIGRRIETLELV